VSVVLLSIKPKYGKAILNQVKKFELRKCVGKPIRSGDLIIMYFTSPVKAVFGYFIAGRVYIEHPEVLKLIMSKVENTGIDEEDWSYVENYPKAMAIEVINPKPCRPVSLEKLRQLGITPPMSYMFLKYDKARQLVRECIVEPY